MGKFGWSLPPGFTTLPGEEPAGPCVMCGGDVDNDKCICPECPQCYAQGDPICYTEHGLTPTYSQLKGAVFSRYYLEQQNRAEYQTTEADYLEYQQMYSNYYNSIDVDYWCEREIARPDADLVLVAFLLFQPGTAAQIRETLKNDLQFQKFQVLFNLNESQLQTVKREYELEKAAHGVQR